MSHSLFSAWDFGGRSMGEIVRGTWREMNEDRIFDSAAALAYYLLLAVFPLLIFLVSIMFTLGSFHLLESFLGVLGHTMPPDAFRLIEAAASKLAKEPSGGLITIGLVATLWSASSGIGSVMEGLNRAYEVEESRSFLKRRSVAIGLTIGLTLLAALGAGMLVASDKIGQLLYNSLELEWTKWVGMALSIISGAAAMIAAFGFMHYFGPSVKGRNKHFVTPGSIIGILLFLCASFGLSVYIRLSGGFSSAVYGAFGGVIVLLLWLYLLGLAILIGGELNSEIIKASKR